MWEVIVGAVAALTGGFGGAWLQARSNRRMLAVQLSDAEKARHEAHAREERIRFLDLRREAYGTLLSRWDELIIAEEVSVESRARYRRYQDDPSSEDSDFDAESAEAKVIENMSITMDLRDVVNDATDAVLLLAPDHILDLLPNYRDPNFEDQRSAFLVAARRDLGVGD